MMNRFFVFALFFVLPPAAPLFAQSGAVKPAANPAAAAPADAPKPEAKPVEADSPWSIGGSFTLAANHLQPRGGGNAGALPGEGFGGESILFGTYKPNDRVTGSARACYGCHGLEVDTAQVEIKLSDVLNAPRFSFGRFPTPFGAAGSRFDHTVYKTPTKPLSTIMGPMVHGYAFNQGVLPSPAVDNGIMLRGDYLLSSMLKWEYAAYMVSGMKSSGGSDLDFITSRDIGDNNGEPFIGGQMRLKPLVEEWPLSFGLSYGIGHHDEDRHLLYDIGAVDASVSHGPLRFTGEFAFRQTQYYDSGGSKDEFLKMSMYLQARFAVNDVMSLVASYEYLDMTDIYLSDFGPVNSTAGAVTDDSNQINRGTLGIALEPPDVPGLTVKAAVDYWAFSDFRDSWVFHVVLAWAF